MTDVYVLDGGDSLSLYIYLQSYCIEYFKYKHTHTHAHFTCQTKINKLLANNQKMLTESEQDFHHPALQHTPICKHLSFLNRRASNFHLFQPAQRPPTHGTCCTVKLPLNELQLKTKLGL